MERAVVSFLAVLLLLVNAVSNTNAKRRYTENELQIIDGRIHECTDLVPRDGKMTGLACYVEGLHPLQNQNLKKEEVTAIVTNCLKRRLPNNPAIHESVEKCLSTAMALTA